MILVIFAQKVRMLDFRDLLNMLFEQALITLPFIDFDTRIIPHRYQANLGEFY